MVRRKAIFLIIGSLVIAAALLGLWFKSQSSRPAADAIATSEEQALEQLRRLLVQKPHQAAFLISWQSKVNERTGWSILNYRRAKHTLIYTPYKDFGKGCPKQYICTSVFEALFTQAASPKSIGAILYASGCSNAGCLTGCVGGCLTAE